MENEELLLISVVSRCK